MASLIKRLLSLAATLFLIATLTFFMMKGIPGDPFNEEQALPPEIHRALRAHYGLDAPLKEQYLLYLSSLVKGDFGPSFKYKDRTINEVIQEGFAVSAFLGIEAFFLALGAGLTLGTASALYRKGWLEGGMVLGTTLALSLPNFAIAILLQYLFAIRWELLPVGRWDSFSHTLLPALSLAAIPMAFIARLSRSSLLEVMEAPYIKTAKAKGLTQSRLLFFHLLPNALLPLLGYLGQLFAGIITGSFVIEQLFAIPGLGQWFVKGVMHRDYTMMMGLTFFYSVILLTSLTFVDLLCRWLDPRIGKGEAP